ncbi:hypothetical protein J6590_017452 [Homalodisca vitripennis]|nr:hypothetical protein J6590_017452 [Homalodisca vitripennis]
MLRTGYLIPWIALDTACRGVDNSRAHNVGQAGNEWPELSGTQIGHKAGYLSAGHVRTGYRVPWITLDTVCRGVDNSRAHNVGQAGNEWPELSGTQTGHKAGYLSAGHVRTGYLIPWIALDTVCRGVDNSRAHNVGQAGNEWLELSGHRRTGYLIPWITLDTTCRGVDNSRAHNVGQAGNEWPELSGTQTGHKAGYLSAGHVRTGYLIPWIALDTACRGVDNSRAHNVGQAGNEWPEFYFGSSLPNVGNGIAQWDICNSEQLMACPGAARVVTFCTVAATRRDVLNLLKSDSVRDLTRRIWSPRPSEEINKSVTKTLKKNSVSFRQKRYLAYKRCVSRMPSRLEVRSPPVKDPMRRYSGHTISQSCHRGRRGGCSDSASTVKRAQSPALV